MTNFCPLSMMFFRIVGRGQDTNVHLLAEHPINTNSLYFDKLLASGLTTHHPLQKKKDSLLTTESYTNPNV